MSQFVSTGLVDKGKRERLLVEKSKWKDERGSEFEAQSVSPTVVCLSLLQLFRPVAITHGNPNAVF